MKNSHDAKYDPASLRRESERMDSIPTEFKDLLQELEQLSY